ncbi:MAG TPA: tRNA pseudouridine(55) synthase, partial [Bacteroidales bacterium]|nr:tRNA pseudouridine(55) synthase [Bacteroidales bacterium]
MTRPVPSPETVAREGLVICIDKPLNWTSADVVRKIRFRLQRYWRIKKLKVGHTGTLDPLATGLLL